MHTEQEDQQNQAYTNQRKQSDILYLLMVLSHDLAVPNVVSRIVHRVITPRLHQKLTNIIDRELTERIGASGWASGWDSR